jgi:hypothetical protein
MAAFSFLDQLLHRLALQVTPVAELSFDMDQHMVRTDPNDIVNERHVFVSGLARAGTTMLMRRFHETGAYRSLTYRDMPFVLAPNLWRRVSGISKREVAAAERAHGDGVPVDVDSPESLDEVFWRIFAGDEYIEKTCLKPHSPDPDLTWKFVCYVNAILAAQETPLPRYLSKNNNNLLRLGGIRRAFPQALILIPFREPVAQASSLLRQHRNFSAMQGEDGFVLSYMTWLTHHEFGLDHRPFRFHDESTAAYNVDELEYWLALWLAVHWWLERSAPEDAIFVGYEQLCEREDVWTQLADIAGVDPGQAEGTVFRASAKAVDDVRDQSLVDEATVTYSRLLERAESALRQ